MKILFDQGTPVPLRRSLSRHEVSTAHEMGVDLDHGKLLSAAEAAFDVFVTTDGASDTSKNLADRRLAILVLPTTSWPRICERVQEVVNAIEALRIGQLVELDW